MPASAAPPIAGHSTVSGTLAGATASTVSSRNQPRLRYRGGPWTPQQVVQFAGTLERAGQPASQRLFSVLAGPGGFTPTGGGAAITSIPRPRRKPFTYASAYGALSGDLAVRFLAITDYGISGAFGSTGLAATGPQVELNIETLEWMWGFGKRFADGDGRKGEPPFVQVNSFDAGGVVTSLFPPNFQSDTGALTWYVSNLVYASPVVRDRAGNRVFADIVVSLTERIVVPGEPTSPAKRQTSRGAGAGYKVYSTTSAVDTIAKVCVHDAGLSSAWEWTAVVAFNQSRLKVKSYTQKLKPNTSVQVPDTLRA
jgi:hypothetical protein